MDMSLEGALRIDLREFQEVLKSDFQIEIQEKDMNLVKFLKYSKNSRQRVSFRIISQ